MNAYQEIKTPIDGLAFFYGEYRGNSIGRAIHYLWSICGSNVGDSCIFHTGGKISLHNAMKVAPAFAYVNWDKGYPFFTFVGENKEYYQKKQQDLLDYTGEV